MLDIKTVADNRWNNLLNGSVESIDIAGFSGTIKADNGTLMLSSGESQIIRALSDGYDMLLQDCWLNSK